MPVMTATAPQEDRVLNFARSELFERTFKEGMALVEEVASYLDGPGRAASKRLPRAAALAYAGESMRLTTRLMQVASWLLVQRALREGSMTLADARDDKYRFATRPEPAPFASDDELPLALTALMARCDAIYERVKRLDENMYGEEPAPAVDGVTAQLARLQAAFSNA